MEHLRNGAAILRNVAVANEPFSLVIPNVGSPLIQEPSHVEDVLRLKSKVSSDESSFDAGKKAGLEEAKEEAYAAGFSSGYEDGYLKGLSVSKDDLEEKFQHQTSENAAMLSKLQQQMRQQFVKRLDAIEDDAVEIIFGVVANILGESVFKAENIKHMVQQTISEVRHRPILKVRLHPDDHGLLISGSEAPVLGSGEQFLWQSDETISLGGCVVETACGELDARFETQLVMLKKMLFQIRASRSLEMES